MFENILGNDEIKKHFEKIVSNNNISHAYLFIGPKGVGKSLFAKEFAKIILNVENVETAIDYKYIARLDSKKDIIVDQIRKNIIDDIYLAPSSGNKKVYIIDDAEYLNTEAQNSLLKTLEEPPIYATIILISNIATTFLPTILSRVSRIDFQKLNDDVIQRYINQKYDKVLDDNIYAYIDGSIGTADIVLTNNMLDTFLKINKLYEYISLKDVVNAFKIKNEIDFNNIEYLKYFEWYINKNKRYTSVKYVENAKIRLASNGNYDIVTDNMILKILEQI